MRGVSGEKRGFGELQRQMKKKKEKSEQKEWQHHEGDFGEYMRQKRRKVETQRRLSARPLRHPEDHGDENGDEGYDSTLFRGVVAWINGRTHPPSHVISEEMVRRGGSVVNTLTSSTTHVICESVPPSKLNSFKSGVKLLLPRWVYACIEAGSTKLRNEHCFLVKSAMRKDAEMKQHKKPKPKLKPKPLPGLSPRRRAQTNLGNPHFVRDFFAHSRLHFIGSWKDRMQQELVPELKQSKPRFIVNDQSVTDHSMSTINKSDGVTLDHSSSDHQKRLVMHVDMDCYFVSVALKKRPHLRGKPVAVCHSDRKTGDSGEISSASYEARSQGVNAGMFVGRALELCPQLELVPYDFEDYLHTSMELYRILYSLTDIVEPKSIDECIVELPAHLGYDENCDELDTIVNDLRKEILEKTGCVASVGVAPNVLLARLALQKAKPNGVCRVHSIIEGKAMLAGCPVRDLPGVGRKMQRKLQQIMSEEGCANDTCGEMISKCTLNQIQSLIGERNGMKIWQFAHGEDDTRLKSGFEFRRRTIAVDIGWGVRFEADFQLRKFIDELSEELQNRLVRARVKGRCLTLKIRSKHPDAEDEPSMKYLGHGHCNTHSRTVPLKCDSKCGVCDWKTISDTAWRAWCDLLAPNISCRIVRAVGLSVGQLCDEDGNPIIVKTEDDSGVSSCLNTEQKSPSKKITEFFGGYDDDCGAKEEEEMEEKEKDEDGGGTDVNADERSMYRQRFIEEMPSDIRLEFAEEERRRLILEEGRFDLISKKAKMSTDDSRTKVTTTTTMMKPKSTLFFRERGQPSLSAVFKNGSHSAMKEEDEHTDDDDDDAEEEEEESQIIEHMVDEDEENGEEITADHSSLLSEEEEEDGESSELMFEDDSDLQPTPMFAIEDSRLICSKLARFLELKRNHSEEYRSVMCLCKLYVCDSMMHDRLGNVDLLLKMIRSKRDSHPNCDFLSYLFRDVFKYVNKQFMTELGYAYRL